MCRIVGYLGPAVSVASLLLDPPRSLREQGRAPRELPPGMLGSDGYGFGWFDERRREPARYRQVLPIWSDVNLATLSPSIHARCIVGSTRTAVDGMPTSLLNTPPFCLGRTLVAHNGSITRFHGALVEKLRARLEARTRQAIQGNTDSEYLAALIEDAAGDSLEARVRSVLELVREDVRDAGTSAQLNLIAAEHDELVAVRYALGAPAPSLYSCQRAQSACLVASEPLDEDETWVRLPESSLLCARRDGEVVTARQSALT